MESYASGKVCASFSGCVALVQASRVSAALAACSRCIALRQLFGRGFRAREVTTAPSAHGAQPTPAPAEMLGPAGGARRVEAVCTAQRAMGE